MQIQPPLAATNVFFQDIQFGIRIHMTEVSVATQKFSYMLRVPVIEPPFLNF